MAKLYLISQDVNNGYDTYDSAVVVSTSEAAAKAIHPKGSDSGGWSDRTWCQKEFVSAQYIGEAADGLEVGEVVLSSFRAG